MKKILSLLAVIVLAITLVSCKKDTEDYLVVGLEADYPPFNWLDTSKNDYNVAIHGVRKSYADGYDVMVAKHIAGELGLKLRVKMLDWDALIPALQNGDIDLIIAGMSPRPDRLEEIDFTDAYYVSKHVAVVLKDGPLANATTLADLSGSNGVGQKGTAYADIIEWLAENHGINELPVADTVPNIVLMLNGGVADFTIVEEPVALGMIATYSNLKIVLNYSVEENIFEVSDEDRVVSIGIKKGREDLISSINQILAEISLQTRNDWMSLATERAEN